LSGAINTGRTHFIGGSIPPHSHFNRKTEITKRAKELLEKYNESARDNEHTGISRARDTEVER